MPYQLGRDSVIAKKIRLSRLRQHLAASVSTSFPTKGWIETQAYSISNELLLLPCCSLQGMQANASNFSSMEENIILSGSCFCCISNSSFHKAVEGSLSAGSIARGSIIACSSIVSLITTNFSRRHKKVEKGNEQNVKLPYCHFLRYYNRLAFRHVFSLQTIISLQ